MTALRWLRAALLCAALQATAAAQDANPGRTGSWYNEPQRGHGFLVEMLENGNLNVFWFTYRPDGTSTFLFEVLKPDGENRYTADLFQTEGMVFGDFDPGTNQLIPWGTLTIEFTGCDSATASWTSDLEGYPPDTIPLQRLTNVAGANCRDARFVGNFALNIDDAGEKTFGRAWFLPDGTFAFFSGDASEYELGLGAWQDTGGGRLGWSAISYVDGEPPADAYDGSGAATRDGFFAQTAGSSIEGLLLDSTQDDLPQDSLAGTYSISDIGGNGSGNAAIDAAGNVSGTFSGCDLEGTVTVPDPDLNQLSADLNVTCPLLGAGRLVGAGGRVPDSQQGDLQVVLVDEVNGGGLVATLVPD